jgi:hypothetical protein
MPLPLNGPSAGTTMIILAATTAATAMQVGEGALLGLKGEGIILITLSKEVVMLKNNYF